MENQAKYRRAYTAQKSNAKRRGIEWELSFEQWREWWGADIDKRGSHKNGLQMQRFADKGPYALGNIKKGYPADNSATWAKTVANRRTAKAKRDHEAFLDALMWARSEEDKPGWVPDEDYDSPRRNGLVSIPAFAIDRL